MRTATAFIAAILFAGLAHSQPCEHFNFYYNAPVKMSHYKIHDTYITSIGFDYKHDWVKKNISLLAGIESFGGGPKLSPDPNTGRRLFMVDYLEGYIGIGKRFHIMVKHDHLWIGATLHYINADNRYIYPPPYFSDLLVHEQYSSTGAGAVVSYFVPVFKYVGIEGTVRSRVYSKGYSPFTTFSLGLSVYIPHKKKDNTNNKPKPSKV